MADYFLTYQLTYIGKMLIYRVTKPDKSLELINKCTNR